jgi:hypothetical protein
VINLIYYKDDDFKQFIVMRKKTIDNRYVCTHLASGLIANYPEHQLVQFDTQGFVEEAANVTNAVFCCQLKPFLKIFNLMQY